MYSIWSTIERNLMLEKENEKLREQVIKLTQNLVYPPIMLDPDSANKVRVAERLKDSALAQLREVEQKLEKVRAVRDRYMGEAFKWQSKFSYMLDSKQRVEKRMVSLRNAIVDAQAVLKETD